MRFAAIALLFLFALVRVNGQNDDLLYVYVAV